MEQFLKSLEKSFASGKELSSIGTALKKYRALARAGLGNPFVDAGEEVLFALFDKKSGQLILPKFSRNLDSLQKAANFFGRAIWHGCRKYGDSSRVHTDSDFCSFVMASTCLIWTYLEIAMHAYASDEVRVFCIDAALFFTHHSEFKSIIDKIFELRAALFPTAAEFVIPSIEHLDSYLSFDSSSVKSIPFTERPFQEKEEEKEEEQLYHFTIYRYPNNSQHLEDACQNDKEKEKEEKDDLD